MAGNFPGFYRVFARAEIARHTCFMLDSQLSVLHSPLLPIANTPQYPHNHPSIPQR
jgi:hypothetical protein